MNYVQKNVLFSQYLFNTLAFKVILLQDNLNMLILQQAMVFHGVLILT